MLMTATSISVLLVEDDERLATFITDYLTERGMYVVHTAESTSALAFLRIRSFDVIVLDVMLPGAMDGFELCKAIRQRSDIPILLVTARGEESDRVLGLELGADDYIVKPYSPRELSARLTAFVRRHRGDLNAKNSVLQVGSLYANTTTITATLDGIHLALSSTEFQLLIRFMERPGRVLSRERLLELVLGSSEDAFDRSVDVQISRLRAKLGTDRRGHALIKTVRGIGYMLVADGDA